jgi:ABC-type amino acid transport substrate-binding protein
MPLGMLWLAGGLSGSVETVPAATAAATGLSLPAWAVLAALASVTVGAAVIWWTVRVHAAGGNGGWRAGVASALCIMGLAALGSGFASGVVAAESTPAAAVPQRVRVAVLPIASAVEWEGDQPTGVAIDIWHDVTQRIGLEADFVRVETFKHVLDMLARGEVDVGLGPIAITEERERLFDLTHPIVHSGLRIVVRQQGASGFLPALRSLFSWQLLELLGTVLLLALASGHLLWWFEHRDNPESFPPQYPRGVWEAIWWIASTVVAGGCDNKHVASGLGRTIAFAWMVGGIVLLAAFTSVLTATLTAEQVAGKIHGPKDLAGRTVGCQGAAVSVKEVRRRGGVVKEYAKLDEALDALELGALDAVVGENQQMMFLLNQPENTGLKLVGPIFETFDYGFGLPNGSPLRERLNTAILRMREDGTMDRIREQWLGRHD